MLSQHRLLHPIQIGIAKQKTKGLRRKHNLYVRRYKCSTEEGNGPFYNDSSDECRLIFFCKVMQICFDFLLHLLLWAIWHSSFVVTFNNITPWLTLIKIIFFLFWVCFNVNYFNDSTNKDWLLSNISYLYYLLFKITPFIFSTSIWPKNSCGIVTNELKQINNKNSDQ